MFHTDLSRYSGESRTGWDLSRFDHISENPIEYNLIKGYKLDDDKIFEMDTIINTEIWENNKYIYIH